MNFKKLCELFEECGHTVRPYTGCGMGERSCLSVDDGGNDLVLEVIYYYLDYLENDFDTSCGDRAYESTGILNELIDMLKGSKIDSMGRGGITYWPNILWEDEPEDSSDD